MGSTGYGRPCVRVYTVPHICGPNWHGAQLGGPIPLTRSQHPSLAIIPLGGSLTKDLIKYCYTRNLIPLRSSHPPRFERRNATLFLECNSSRIRVRIFGLLFMSLPIRSLFCLVLSCRTSPFRSIVVDHFVRSYRASSRDLRQ